MHDHDEDNFDFGVTLPEPPPIKSKYPSADEMRNLLAGHDPEREPQPIAKTMTGSITRIYSNTGFIRTDDDRRGILFNQSDVTWNRFDGLRVGQRVQFEVARTQLGYVVSNVEPINSAG